MNERINTGNYKVYRHQIGIGGSIELLFTTDNKQELDSYWKNNIPIDEYTYYREEEVIYKKTRFDSNGNLIDSKPTWVRMNNT